VLVLFEADARGPCRRIEIFAAGHLDDAIVRLYDRHAELIPAASGGARTAAATAASIATVLVASLDADRYGANAAVVSPAIEFVDHRTLGMPAGRGPDEALRNIRALHELTADATFLVHDILGLESGVLLLRTLIAGTDRASGGRFELPALNLVAFDEDGRIARYENFDVGGEAEALARFDAMAGTDRAQPIEERFANVAARAMRTFERSWCARDWDAVRATYHPAHRMDDRRRLMRMAVAGDEFFANERMLFDETASSWNGDLLATRGDALALFRVRFTATVPGSGPMEVEALDLVEVDAAGLRTALIVFDPDDLDAAYAELDARWYAGEARGHPHVAAYQAAFVRDIATREWDALAALHAPTLVARDHRLVGWDVLHGSAAFVGALRAMVDLAPDAAGRADHIRISARALLGAVVWVGTRDGGAFESPFLWVAELDAEGVAQHLDLYDPHHLDAAQARFDAIQARAPVAPEPRAIRAR
jgi:hypothetical protein